MFINQRVGLNPRMPAFLRRDEFFWGDVHFKNLEAMMKLMLSDSYVLACLLIK